MTRDDHAIMSMAEQGLGISILPELILRRIPYDVVVKPLDCPAYRTIGIAMQNQETASAAVIKLWSTRTSGKADRQHIRAAISSGCIDRQPICSEVLPPARSRPPDVAGRPDAGGRSL